MKNLKIAAVLLVMLFVTGACKKKNDPAPAPAPAATPASSSSMSAVLNGANWNASSVTGMLLVDTDQDLSGLVLNGITSSDIIAIGIDFPTANSNMSTGSHDFGGNMDDVVFTYTRKTSGGGSITEHFPKAGNVVITSVDNANKKVSGTFDAIMAKPGAKTKADSLFITNGVFNNVSYTIQNQ